MNKNLSSRLLYLSMMTLSKVELWLTLKGHKEVCSIPLRDNFSQKNKKSLRIINWINDARLFYAVDIKNKNLIHVSLNKELAKKMAELQWSDKPEDILFRGINYGYPKEAVKAFVYDFESLGNSTKYPFWEYARYRVRNGHEKEDLKPAQTWGKFIRKEIPKLATWFENSMNRAKF